MNPDLYCTHTHTHTVDSISLYFSYDTIRWITVSKTDNRALKHDAGILHLKCLRKSLDQHWSPTIMINPTTLDGAVASPYTYNTTLHLCDAGCSWHIPDNFDSLSLRLVRAAGRAAHDWHADGQTNSENLKTSCPCHGAICCFLSNWMMSASIGMWAWAMFWIILWLFSVSIQ